MTKAEEATQFAKILDRAGIDPARIKLEVTETVFIEEPEATQQMLSSLRALGFGVSLDDFGTGYSSLSHLQKFGLDDIKIDQSFVRRMHSDGNSLKIVKASIDLARALGIGMIAEGVETKEDAERLAAMNCSYAQGYYYAKPLPLSEAKKYSPRTTR